MYNLKVFSSEQILNYSLQTRQKKKVKCMRHYYYEFATSQLIQFSFYLFFKLTRSHSSEIKSLLDYPRHTLLVSYSILLNNNKQFYKNKFLLLKLHFVGLKYLQLLCLWLRGVFTNLYQDIPELCQQLCLNDALSMKR